jgi:G3E family GTPase
MTGHFSALLSAAPEPGDRIPVTVLTGFLGSGKTTLLNRLLREPDLQGTAVIVNEFGEIGIDHDLIVQAHDDTVLLANGCLCCAVRGDLVQALLQLTERGTPPARVLIETSGLADPGPILRTLMGEPAVRRHFALAGVACTVDAVLGQRTLERHSEAARQVAVADALFLTKTDLLEAPLSAELLARLQGLNPGAAWHDEAASQPQALRALLHASRAGEADADAAGSAPAYRRLTTAPSAADSNMREATHTDGIRSFVIVRDAPFARARFATWLDMVIAMRGEDLLRVKGLVHIAEQPDQPLVVHGVQHLFAPPHSLPRWPGDDHRTRIVFITRGITQESVEDTLRLFEPRRTRTRLPPAIAS